MGIVQAGSGFPYLSDAVFIYLHSAIITSIKDNEVPNEVKQLVQKVIVPMGL